MALAACGISQASPSDSTDSDTTSSATTKKIPEGSRVDIFVPSDGITLTQNTPTNKWGSFTSAVTKQLEEEGYASDSVNVTASGSLKDQAQALEQLVSDVTADAGDEGASSNSDTHDVVLLAPALTLDSETKQFGDLIGDGSEHLEKASTVSATLSADQQKEQEEAEKSIVASSAALRKAGDTIVLVSRHLPGVVADGFVKTSDAYDIGALQANQLAKKLELSEATAQNPKRIEIVIPKESNTTISSDFFRGVWSVLGPYFKAGSVISGSGRVTKTSSAASWKRVLLEADSATTAQAGFEEILDASSDARSTGSPVKLDGVIASNDFLAAQVSNVLKDRGYTGSAADINPEITIGGIVGNITGNSDLNKDKVPSPSAEEDSPSSSLNSGDDDSDSDSSSDEAQQWPIVTGFGSYASNVQLVVSGKQWLTGLENRTGLATDVAKACADVARHGKLTVSKASGSYAASSVTLKGHKVAVITRSLVGVTGSNLKTALIDTGYVSAADAGL